MNANSFLQTALFIAVLIALAFPVGRYMTAVLDGSSVVVRKFGAINRRVSHEIFAVADNSAQ